MRGGGKRSHEEGEGSEMKRAGGMEEREKASEGERWKPKGREGEERGKEEGDTEKGKGGEGREIKARREYRRGTVSKGSREGKRILK